jgi:hypothetical protein
MTPNSAPLSDETQDAAEDFEEPRPQDVGPSLPATSSSSSSFHKIFVKNSALEDLISSADDSLPFTTTDSADVSHDDVRLQDPTLQPGYRPRGDQHTSQASSSWEVRDQPRRSLADEPEDRGRMLELHPGPPVPPRMIFSPENKRRRQLLQNQVSIKRQQYEQAVLQFVRASPDIYDVNDAYIYSQ